MNKTLEKILLVGVGFVIGLSLFNAGQKEDLLLSGTAINVPTFGQGADLEDQASTTAFTLGNSSVQILATSSQRWWAAISNTGTSTVFINFDNDKAAAADTGILLAASSTLIINKDNLWQGGVRAINPTGVDALIVTELRRKQ